jgi:predicted unusual protein kinase regulating ubiquinone biosynthesis (AarF/ABC1/UbiB family)
MEAFYRHAIFNGDPHPGNYLFLADGRVAFLDYGCALAIDPADVARFAEMHRRNLAGDLKGAAEAVLDLFEIDRKKTAHTQAITEYVEYILRPYQEEAPFAYTREYARESVTVASALFKRTLLSTGAVPTTPARLTFLNRMQWGFLSVLGALGARLSCRAIMREILSNSGR